MFTKAQASTYGRSEAGKWVETTTHSKDFITRTEAYDKPGGKLVSRETTRKAADGREVTFHGQWKDGKWVETAVHYLGYESVAVEYDHPNGHPVKRYGQLTGGRYATDTFDSSGQHVVKREIFDKRGGRLLETWTGSGSQLTISRDNPTGAIAHDRFSYRWVTYESTGVDATFKRPLSILFDGGGEAKDSTEYHWRTWTDKNRETHYRESRQGGRGHNQESYGNPYPGEKVGRPAVDVYWNKS